MAVARGAFKSHKAASIAKEESSHMAVLAALGALVCGAVLLAAIRSIINGKKSNHVDFVTLRQ
jgi:hypothetical protein